MSGGPVIFAAFANGSADHRLNYLKDERQALEKALWVFEKEKQICELKLLFDASFRDIAEVFNDDYYQGRIAVFHYAGHADEYHLLLEEAERSEKVSRKGFAGFLATQAGLGLVFLNGCSTQKHAEELIEKGIPLVVATDTLISDQTAAGLSGQFYRALGLGRPFSIAWDQARSYVQAKGRPGDYRDLYQKDVPKTPDRLPWEVYLGIDGDRWRNWSIPVASANPLIGLPELPDLDVQQQGTNPFPGLVPYSAGQAHFFAGRDREIRALYEILENSADRLLVLSGPVGSGKTSLIHAGLIPRLADWDIFPWPPGTLNPLEEPLQEKGLLVWDGSSEKSPPPSHRVKAIIERTKCLLEENGLLKVVFVVRDELAKVFREYLVEQLCISRTFPLKHMSSGQIKEVLGRLPAWEEKRDRWVQVEPQFEEALVQHLFSHPNASSGTLFSLMMRELYELVRVRDGINLVFSLHQLDTYLGAEWNPLARYFDRQLGELRRIPEFEAVWQSGLVLNILQDHISIQGSSQPVREAYLRERYGHRSEPLAPILNALSSRGHLLHRPYDPTGKTGEFTQLIHPGLAPVILARHAASLAPGQQARRILDHAVETDGLLTGKELRELRAARENFPQPSSDQAQVIQKSRLHHRRKTFARWLGKAARYSFAGILIAKGSFIGDPFLLLLILLFVVLVR